MSPRLSLFFFVAISYGTKNSNHLSHELREANASLNLWILFLFCGGPGVYWPRRSHLIPALSKTYAFDSIRFNVPCILVGLWSFVTMTDLLYQCYMEHCPVYEFYLIYTSLSRDWLCSWFQVVDYLIEFSSIYFEIYINSWNRIWSLLFYRLVC
jgi:hypothetical protein